MAEKVALVTGAAAGIGAGCAVRLARDGVAIGVLDLDEARCAATVADVQAAGGRAVALGADISERAQVKAAVARLRETRKFASVEQLRTQLAHDERDARSALTLQLSAGNVRG